MTQKIDKHEINLSRWEFIRNVTRQELIDLGYSRSTRGWYKCKVCETMKHISKADFKKYTTVCDNGCHGASLQPSKVVIGVDDVATTNPQLIKYFVNEEDTKKHRTHSNKKVELKCPNCNHKKFMTVDKLVSRGFSCPVCSDGFSYPEKLMSSLLLTLKVDYKAQFSFDGGLHKYDFYLPKFNTIIETHGRQHYEHSRRKGERVKTLEEEQENDRLKMKNALYEGIDKYIIIDCSESTLSYIKENIIKSELSDILNLNEVDWVEVGKRCETSLVFEVINYYNEYKCSPTKIASHFNLAKNTIRNYIARGEELGLCKYEGVNNGKPVVMIVNNEIKDFDNSIINMANKMRITRTTFGRMLNGKPNIINQQEMRFYLINSELWEQNKHLYSDPLGLLSA